MGVRLLGYLLAFFVGATSTGLGFVAAWGVVA
jgi:hypothetical protein